MPESIPPRKKHPKETPRSPRLNPVSTIAGFTAAMLLTVTAGKALMFDPKREEALAWTDNITTHVKILFPRQSGVDKEFIRLAFKVEITAEEAQELNLIVQQERASIEKRAIAITTELLTQANRSPIPAVFENIGGKASQVRELTMAGMGRAILEVLEKHLPIVRAKYLKS